MLNTTLGPKPRFWCSFQGQQVSHSQGVAHGQRHRQGHLPLDANIVKGRPRTDTPRPPRAGHASEPPPAKSESQAPEGQQPREASNLGAQREPTLAVHQPPTSQGTDLHQIKPAAHLASSRADRERVPPSLRAQVMPPSNIPRQPTLRMKLSSVRQQLREASTCGSHGVADVRVSRHTIRISCGPC